ncbi:MAG: benzoyl-CoA-dihydrodiol lyase [Myxococcales bacterium]|nr:benzoyl-CoA-dihydrodiol lyase [Myxococcales bacterium]
MGSEPKITRVESFSTHPDRYRHWKLSFDGPVATLALDIQEGNGLRPDDYELKQNSYDLGVDIELADAVERIRFEHPEVKAVVLTSAQDRIFCAGANIKMLATSTHGFKVNFCRYTNETRCGIEDASTQSGIRFLAALNGTAAGGGYELALTADRIVLVDDGSSAVSLPEVPLLGVLPGTGGLTRLVDKRAIRRDVADLFCTKAEGFRARDARKLNLIDGSFPRSRWEDGVKQEAAQLAATGSDRTGPGIELTPVVAPYTWVSVEHAEDGRLVTLTVRAPDDDPPTTADALRAAGASTWAMAAFRELDDALLHLRFTFDRVGLVLLKTSGDAERVLAHDRALAKLAADGDWLAREMELLRARILRRLDNTAKSLFAIVEPGSCFVGSLFEMTLAADRTYMLEDEDGDVTVQLTEASDGRFPMSTGISRLKARFLNDPEGAAKALEATEPLDAPSAFDLGLVTLAPDDIDWEDELRIAIEERLSLSPDALTGMEQNLRFAGAETCDSKIFGRLSAWQNWIFQRPNAVGDEGALTLYGHPTRPKFDFRRT